MASVVNELFSNLVKNKKTNGHPRVLWNFFFEIASRRMSLSTLVTEK